MIQVCSISCCNILSFHKVAAGFGFKVSTQASDNVKNYIEIVRINTCDFVVYYCNICPFALGNKLW